MRARIVVVDQAYNSILNLVVDPYLCRIQQLVPDVVLLTHSH